MTNPRSFAVRICLVACAALATAILVEIASRVYLVEFARKEVFDKYASLRQLEADRRRSWMTPHRYLGFYPTPNYTTDDGNRHNTLGYRGGEIEQAKPPGSFRIAALGGSTTYTSAVRDHRLSYPALLEKDLHERGRDQVEVVNAGAPYWSSWESLINLELRVLDLEPDLIIIYQAINDVHPRFVWPPGAYRGDNSGHRKAYSAIFMPSVLEYSTALRILLIRAGWAVSHNDLERGRAETSYAQQFRQQKADGSYPQGIFERVSARQMLATNQPVYFRRNIENQIAIAQARGIEVVLATFAFSSEFPSPVVSSDEYATALDEMNQVIREIAHDTSVHLFDFARAFPADRQLFADGRHVNERGARLKARLFAAFLLENDLVPTPVRP